MRKIFALIILVISSSVTTVDYKENDSIDYVPDADTAKKVAEAIWTPIFGKRVKSLKPYEAYLIKDNSVWVVNGTLPEGYLGGVPYIEINKKDCRILKVTHGK